MKNTKNDHSSLRRFPACAIVVRDNGKGFVYEDIPSNHGIGNIQKRVEKLGGNLNFDTGKKAGTTIFIDLPWPL